jgi:hypothetical protein
VRHDIYATGKKKHKNQRGVRDRLSREGMLPYMVHRVHYGLLVDGELVEYLPALLWPHGPFPTTGLCRRMGATGMQTLMTMAWLPEILCPPVQAPVAAGNEWTIHVIVASTCFAR